jgi:hypothetical protein
MGRQHRRGQPAAAARPTPDRLRLPAVRYCEIDYAMPDRPGGREGPRQVASAAEWREPPFYEFGDCTDYGLELQSACGPTFTVSWDSPGRHEGI